MVIRHNLTAMEANRQLSINNDAESSSIEKLSSGYRINKAADDAAGLAISQKMISQIAGLNQGSTNAQDGVSLIQTAEGAASETQSMLQRLKTLATQSSNGTLQSSDRAQIQTEVTQLKSEITRLASTTTFNGINLLKNNNNKINFQVGGQAGDVISITLSSANAGTLGTYNNGTIATMSSYDNGTGTVISGVQATISNISLSSQGGASAALNVIDNAINQISTTRANFGAVQNRLQHTITATDNTSENLSSAESRIMDVDMASEMMNYSSQKVLVSAAQSMLSQANQNSQGVLSLLQG